MIEEKLQEYIRLMDFNDDYYKNDYKSQVKFMKYAISSFLKKKLNNQEIVNFLQMAINIHKEIYGER